MKAASADSAWKPLGLSAEQTKIFEVEAWEHCWHRHMSLDPRGYASLAARVDAVERVANDAAHGGVISWAWNSTRFPNLYGSSFFDDGPFVYDCCQSCDKKSERDQRFKRCQQCKWACYCSRQC